MEEKSLVQMMMIYVYEGSDGAGQIEKGRVKIGDLAPISCIESIGRQGNLE